MGNPQNCSLYRLLLQSTQKCHVLVLIFDYDRHGNLHCLVQIYVSLDFFNGKCTAYQYLKHQVRDIRKMDIISLSIAYYKYGD